MTTAVEFRDKLKSTVEQLGLNSENWSSNKWLDLTKTISLDVTKDAFNQMSNLKDIFGDDITTRSEKKVERIIEKLSEQREIKNYFKCISDLTAMRIICKVSDIQIQIEKVKELTTSLLGIYYVREPYCHKDDKYIDIIQYMYVYIPDIGYITEIQIGHEFAFLSFSINSAIRSGQTGLVDLWSHNFYQSVRDYILAKTNKEVTEINDIYLTVKTFYIFNNQVPKYIAEMMLNIFSAIY